MVDIDFNELQLLHLANSNTGFDPISNYLDDKKLGKKKKIGNRISLVDTGLLEIAASKRGEVLDPEEKEKQM